MAFLEATPENKLETNYADSFNRWKTQPDKTNTGALLRTIEPEIRRGIFAHVGSDNPLLKSKARQLALQSMKTYDPSRAKLGTHIVNSMQGLKRINRKQTEIIAVPERLMYDRGNIERMSTELEEELGREPSMQELADSSGFSPKRINRALNMQNALSESTFTRGGAGESEGGGIAVNPTRQSNWAEVLYHDMDPVNQKIMEWSLGMYDMPTISNKEIARRLRITPGAVTQRKQRIQQQLDSMQDIGGEY